MGLREWKLRPLVDGAGDSRKSEAEFCSGYLLPRSHFLLWTRLNSASFPFLVCVYVTKLDPESFQA
jgi:hypothetical protein